MSKAAMVSVMTRKKNLSLSQSEDRAVLSADVPQKPALLIVNLGTPDEATPSAVRRFLRAFLTDRRVIETHPILWRPILEGIILRIRPSRVAHAYRTIWSEDGSPLLVGTMAQVEGLRQRLGSSVEVRPAMCYGSGNIREVLDDLYAEGYRRVAIVPAYPQYSASTVGAVFDEVARWGLGSRDQLSVRTVRSYEDAPAYIEALATALEESWRENGRPDFEAGDVVLASFHSIPQAMVDKGDPYELECERTVRLLRQRLGCSEKELILTYQSVFGPAKWIGPATIDTVESLGAQGRRRVDVICPGFVADCLETLEEINVLNRQVFIDAGGKTFNYIPWANGSSACVDMLEEQAKEVLAGWVNAPAAVRA